MLWYVYHIEDGINNEWRIVPPIWLSKLLKSQGVELQYSAYFRCL